MKARLITRCGCERTIEVTAPPPPEIVLPLRPPKANNGLVRPWMMENAALRYDITRDGAVVRKFRLGLEALHDYHRHGCVPWYDEATDYDPAGYDPGKRTYERETI